MSQKNKNNQEEPRIIMPDDEAVREMLHAQEGAGAASASPEEKTKEQAASDSQKQIAELTDKLQRVAADYQNYQKRTDRQIEQSQQLTREMLVKSLLGVLDDFERMLEQGSQATDVANLLQGVRMVYDHFCKVLENMGLERIDAKPGEPFDPNKHEAMMHQPCADVEPDTICSVLARGYLMGEHVLRPMRVAVAKAPQENTGSEDSIEPRENEA